MIHTYIYQSNTAIRQHTSAYVSIRCAPKHTHSSIDPRSDRYVSIRQHTSAYVSIRQHTSAYVSIRQHTSAYGVSLNTYTAVQTGGAIDDLNEVGTLVSNRRLFVHTACYFSFFVSYFFLYANTFIIWFSFVHALVSSRRLYYICMHTHTHTHTHGE